MQGIPTNPYTSCNFMCSLLLVYISVYFCILLFIEFLLPFPSQNRRHNQQINQKSSNFFFVFQISFMPKKMKSRYILLTLSIVIAIIAILASQTLFSTPPRVFIHNPFDILYGIKAISYSAITSVCSHHHHHH